MKERHLSYIIKNEKWKFYFSDYLNRYFFLVVPVGFIILGIYPLFDKNVLSRFSLAGFYSFFPFWFLAIGTSLLVYSYRRIESERIFRKIEIQREISSSELSSWLVELGWSIEDVKQKFIIAETDWSAFSWGEEITIVLCRDYLLINSRTTGSQPFTMGRDIYNYKRLKEYLELRLLAR
ncbi:hypothetical protein PDL71_00785 [Lacibacter sp. MH-610]|uniref:hypothetical protein n=1 Tax=Lacibacter sp. MH-610 TaxID=3020883 RepID=UPI0038924F4B